jgi:hypothetical protein
MHDIIRATWMDVNLPSFRYVAHSLEEPVLGEVEGIRREAD